MRKSRRASNRRVHRSENITEALQLQLVASARRAGFRSLVLADDLGLVVASAGEPKFQHHLAALAPELSQQGKVWHGNLKFRDSQIRLSVAPIRFGESTFYLSATAGRGRLIPRELFQSGRGCERILS